MGYTLLLENMSFEDIHNMKVTNIEHLKLKKDKIDEILHRTLMKDSY